MVPLMAGLPRRGGGGGGKVVLEPDHDAGVAPAARRAQGHGWNEIDEAGRRMSDAVGLFAHARPAERPRAVAQARPPVVIR